MRIARPHYYYKILLWVFAIVIVPLLTVGFVLGTQLFSSLSQRAVQLEELALSQSVIQTEEQLRGLQRAALQFSFQEDTMRATRLNDAQEDLVLFNKLKNNCIGLRQTFNSRLPIRGVSVASSGNKWAYDTELGYQPADAAAYPASSFRPADNKWTVEMEYAKNAYFELTPVDYVLVWRTRFLNFGEVAIRVNYRDFCKTFDVYRPFSNMYVLENGGSVIYGGATEDIGAPAASLPFYRCLSGESGQFSFSMDDGRYSGIFRKSKELNWIYVSVWKEAFSRRKFFGGFIMATIISFMVLTAALFGSVILSRKLYRPVYDLWHRLEYFISGDSSEKGRRLNEFQAIETTVGKMIGDNRRLQREAGSQRLLMRKLMICQMFTGHLAPAQQDLLKDYNITLPWRYKVVVTISSPQIRQNDSGKASEVYFLGVRQMILELLPDNALIAPVMIDNMIVLILGGNGADFDRALEDAVRTIYDRITHALNPEVGIAVSTRFRDIGQIADAFDRIRQLSKYHNGVPGGICYLGKSGQIRYPCKMSEAVLEGIKSGDTKNALKALDAFLDDVFLRTQDGYQQQLYIMWMIGDILRLVPDYSAFIVNRSTAPAHTDPVQTLFSISSLEDKKGWMLDNVIRPVNDMLHTNDANKLFIVKRMVSFIRENAGGSSGDIEACSSFLNYNSSYLRKVFKDIMGVSYGKYTARVLLEKACDLLRTTDLPVSDIARQIGYSNSQNFIRCFKSEFGTTPGQFRSAQNRSAFPRLGRR